jgi:hypothetical protein
MQGESNSELLKNMKTSLKIFTQLLLILLSLASAPTSSCAQQGGVPGAPGGSGLVIDPTTGLALAERQWKDPKWTDPDKVLDEVVYENLPLAEIASDLRKKFSDAFDVLLPGSMLPGTGPISGWTEPASTPITIRLKNVKASEVFNAMNMVFETESSPLRWELKMNGTRPTVLLRVTGMFFPPQETKRQIYFVGELLENSPDGLTMQDLVKTISEVYEMSYGSQRSISDHLQFHKQAQLLVVNGNDDEIKFVEQTLAALRQKVDLRQRTVKPATAVEPKPEPKSASEKSKSP